jgi:GNAT superfamily N-acetyltransferase
MDLFDEHITLRAVIDSALECRLGEVRYDDVEAPRVGRIDLGCYAIFSGDAAHPLAAEWIGGLAPPLEIVLPEDQAWRDLVDRLLGDRCIDRPMRTFALHELDYDALRPAAAAVPDGFRVAELDVELVGQFDDDLHPHALRVFPSAAALVEQGIGYAVVAPDGRVAAQTSSYAISSERVEVAIATHPEFRRLGLARVVAARMLLGCRERGLRPEWSASNPVSKRLARSLGSRPAGLCDIVFFE